MTASRALLAAPTALASCLDTQAGVVTREQLSAAGVGEGRVRAAVAARRWQAIGQRVVVVHNAELTDQQRLWVAVLLPDQPAALAGLTAAAVAGLRGFTPDEVHLVVAGSCGVDLPSWITLHNSRRFSRPTSTHSGRSRAPGYHVRSSTPRPGAARPAGPVRCSAPVSSND